MNVDAIATEVETLRQRLPAVERAHRDAQQAAEEADSRRVRLAYAVHVEHREELTADLERAAADYDDAKRKAHDTEMALISLEEKGYNEELIGKGKLKVGTSTDKIELNKEDGKQN